jgi:tetratricopeptide (TPR) repeat protein
MKNKSSLEIMKKNKDRYEKLSSSQKIYGQKPLYEETSASMLSRRGKEAAKILNTPIKIKNNHTYDKNLHISFLVTFLYILAMIAVYVFTNMRYSGFDLARRADAYFNSEEYFNAAKYYDKAINLKFSNSDILTKYASALIKLGNYGAAVKNFKKILEMQPGHIDVIYEVANTLYAKGKHSDDRDAFLDAANYLKQVIELSPNKKDAYSLIGLCYRAANMPQEARQWYDRALTSKKFPAADFLNAAGHTFLDEEKFQEAADYYKRAAVAEPSYFLSYYNMGAVYEKMGETDLSIQNYKRAIALNGDFMDSYIRLGDIYFGNRNFDEAIQWFLAALKKDPDNMICNYRLALAYKNAGRNKEAEQYFEKAAYLGSDEAVEEMRKNL